VRRRLIGASLAVVLALAGCTSGSPRPGPSASSASSASSSAAAAGFQPGAAGVGDPYYPTYGNGGYDVASYGLKVRYDPPSNQLTAAATITATATADLSRFNLDLAGLTVRSVTVDGKAATSRRDKNELVVTPGRGIARGARFTVDIAYGGQPGPVSPNLGAGGFLHSGGAAVAVGQPESASAWFPVNDHPSDKATYAIEVTVPAGTSAISNGVLVGSSTTGGWTTWRWREQAPMASYLVTLAVGRYRVKTGEHDGKPVLTAVAGSLPEGGSADRALDRTTEITDFLSTQFGPYPFDAYGGIVIDDDRVNYALETQSRPVYGPSFFDGDGDASWVVAHELAHQWYGDSVSVRRWRDIWLNEGFATYAEWLWGEHTGGPSMREAFEDAYRGSGDQIWQVPPGDPGVEDLFSRSVYQRGAMTLQALRLTVGDDAFFRILKTWAADKRGGNGTTDEFVALAERVSGKSLRSLFDAWLYKKSKPPLPS
jgi:aminopeptidase N